MFNKLPDAASREVLDPIWNKGTKKLGINHIPCIHRLRSEFAPGFNAGQQIEAGGTQRTDESGDDQMMNRFLIVYSTCDTIFARYK